MLSEARLLRRWFELISRAMGDNADREWALADILAYVTTTPIDSDLLAPGPTSQKQRITDALEAVLQFFEHWKLITGRLDRERYTRNLRIPVPARVGRLSPRGRCVASRPPLQQTGFFLFAVGVAKLKPMWNRFRIAVVVAGAVLTIAKLVLEWGTIPAAAAAIGTAIMAIILTMLATSGS
jgi:hypothetical protein